MKINCAILTHDNEDVFVLISDLERQTEYDGAYILDDFSKPEFFNRLTSFCAHRNIPLAQRALNHHFANQRNALFDLMPRGELTLVIDPDERVGDTFFKDLKAFVAQHPEADAFRMTRHNIRIFGAGTFDDCKEPTQRLFVNNGKIRYVNAIHEGIEGVENVVDCPADLVIEHVKMEWKAHLAHRFYDEHWYQKGRT